MFFIFSPYLIGRIISKIYGMGPHKNTFISEFDIIPKSLKNILKITPD